MKDYGDRYGSGHRFPYGSAWWMAIVSFLPWTPLLLAALLRRRKDLLSCLRDSKPLALAVIWAVAPLCFLTFIRQLHVGYILPAVPGLSLLTACVVSEARVDSRKAVLAFERRLRQVALLLLGGALPALAFWIAGTDLWAFVFVPVGLGLLILSAKRFPNETRSSAYGVLGLVVAVIFGGALLATDSLISHEKSTSGILRRISALKAETPPQVVFIDQKSYSSWFYAAAWEEELGAPVTTDYLPVEDVIKSLPQNIVVNSKQVPQLPAALLARYAYVLSDGKWSWLKLKA